MDSVLPGIEDMLRLRLADFNAGYASCRLRFGYASAHRSRDFRWITVMQLGKLIQENGVSRVLRASWKRLSKAITDPMLDELRLRRVDAHAPIAIDGVQSRQRDGTEASVAALLAI